MQKDFSYPVKIADLNRREQHFNLKADSSDLEELRQILQVPAVVDFEADIYLTPDFKAHRIDVRGSVRATLTLQSVISLELFDKTYENEFTSYFDTKATYKDLHNTEADGTDWQEEQPDLIENGQIDLGSMAIERLALVMDDYPRREGEAFSFESEFDEETTKAAHPFAVLAKLKK